MSFTYNVNASNGKRLGLQSITSNSKTYAFTYEDFTDQSGRFLLRSVQPPEGPSWQFDYSPSGISGTQNEELTRITYPTGGIMDYVYETRTFSGFDTIRSVKTKTTSGRNVTVGTYTYNYNRYISSGSRKTSRTIVTEKSEPSRNYWTRS